MWKYHTWLAAYGGKRAHAAAKQLIATARSHDLKIQSLVKLAQLLGPETDAQRHGIIGGNHPAMIDQLRSTGSLSSITALKGKLISE